MRIKGNTSGGSILDIDDYGSKDIRKLEFYSGDP